MPPWIIQPGNNLASTTLFGTMIGPSWLNLMSSSHVGRSTGGSETGRSRRSVKRSATCRAQSATRTPFCDLNSSSDSSNLIGTPDETIDNVARGLADQENANEVPSANSTSSAVVPSSSSGDTKRVRWGCFSNFLKSHLQTVCKRCVG